MDISAAQEQIAFGHFFLPAQAVLAATLIRPARACLAMAA